MIKESGRSRVRNLRARGADRESRLHAIDPDLRRLGRPPRQQLGLKNSQAALALAPQPALKRTLWRVRARQPPTGRNVRTGQGDALARGARATARQGAPRAGSCQSRRGRLGP